jgi:adenosylcobinamide kinase / adenosylcobinamide-phosphate guanylyltransferase
MVEPLSIARSELILGGQRSGKSARAERLAAQWLAQSPQHSAVLLATGQTYDEEMRERIARHQADRAARVPSMRTVEEPLNLAEALTAHSAANTLIVIDCLTLWLTNLLMPHVLPEIPSKAVLDVNNALNRPLAQQNNAQEAMLLRAIELAKGPVVIVTNEIGLGVIPMGSDVRAYVDALGRLNQDVAKVCSRVTLMAAGLPLLLKDLE